MKRIIALLVAVVVFSAATCEIPPPPPFSFKTLTVTLEGQGTVTRAEGEGTVEVGVELFGEGAQVTLTATPADGWSFQQWEGDTTGPDSPVTVTLDADKNITAVFIAVALDEDDADGDGVPDSDDVCPGFDDNLDDDGDAVPDGCDACPGGDDGVDTDGDGVADFCDPCPDDNPDDTDGNGVCDSDGPEPLSFLEEEVVGKWYRYHGYDGSGRYLIFRTDRTGCMWERPSSGGRIDESTIYYWELDEDNPVGNNVFLIMWKTSPNGSLYGSWEYHYIIDEIWRGGYRNLDYTRSTTWRDCE